MDWLYPIVQWVHITCGSVALVAGPAAMLATRTGRHHRAWGQVYLGLPRPHDRDSECHGAAPGAE